MPATIRISQAAHQSLTRISKETNTSLQEVLNEAIENHRRRVLLGRANAGYAKLRQDKKAWQQWKRELRSLDTTLGDGI
jgi:mRNA-degrading endonuclease RelE of RelBE toxin-antitoxin system